MIYNSEQIQTIIDGDNKFIRIDFKDKVNIKFVDSTRIFPVSLDGLCNIFNGGEGKVSKYNPAFNTIDLLSNYNLLKSFIDYSLNDSIILFKCILNASITYLEKYDIDLSDSLSLSSLSLKIFRKRFQNIKIPILKHKMDVFIRVSFYGGSTDYYLKYVKKVYFYDVNSLYPFAMLKEMPLNPIRYVSNINNITLDNFFGFALAKITTPPNIKIPLLIYRHVGKVIHPTGTWVGVYFSEELKAVQKYGYKIELIKGIEFSKVILFEVYIKHFYEIKKVATGPLRWIAKMQLKSLLLRRFLPLTHSLSVSFFFIFFFA